MATGNLQHCLAEIWPFEGGYVDHPKDPGGATNMGITFAVLQAWRKVSITKQDVRNLTKAEAQQIYEARYWRPLRGDDLRLGDDLVILDFGINSGIDRSARYVQAIVGVPQDGRIGPVTLAALAKMPSRDFIKKLCAKRLSFVQALKIWETFGKGWARRIAHMEATALSWVSTPAQLEKDAEQARDAAARQGGGALIGSGGSVALPDVTGLPGWAVVAVVAAIAIPLLVLAMVNFQRAAALKSVAA